MIARLTARVRTSPTYFPEDHFVSTNRFRQQGIDTAALNLLGDKTSADEDSDEQTEYGRGTQSHILHDLDILSGRELTDEVGCRNHEHSEQDEVVKYLVSNRFSERVDSDSCNDSHTILTARHHAGGRGPPRGAVRDSPDQQRTPRGSPDVA